MTLFWHTDLEHNSHARLQTFKLQYTSTRHATRHVHDNAGTFSLEGRQTVCGALVREGKATWLDKDQTVCLVTVQTLQQWAETILNVVKTRFSTNIMTVDHIYSGDDALGTGVVLLFPWFSPLLALKQCSCDVTDTCEVISIVA